MLHEDDMDGIFSIDTIAPWENLDLKTVQSTPRTSSSSSAPLALSLTVTVNFIKGGIYGIQKLHGTRRLWQTWAQATLRENLQVRQNRLSQNWLSL